MEPGLSDMAMIHGSSWPGSWMTPILVGMRWWVSSTSTIQPITAQPIRVLQQQPDNVVQDALIAFQSDHVVTLLLDYLDADRALETHGIYRRDSARTR